MNLEKTLPTPWRRSKWLWAIVAAIAVVIIIIIVVPLAVILPKKKNHHESTPAANVIVPLYIYPLNNTTWDPVYTAFALRPDLNFTVIVNPSSGPGDTEFPNADYTEAISKLNAFDNVRTVGYVRTGYATRNITNVTSEVATYAGWSGNSSSLAMHGIFFDESPYEYSADAVAYMSTIDSFVKDSAGILGSKTVIHNPGVIPDSRYNDTNLDITVIFEQTYTEWQNKSVSVEALPATRGAYSIMVNSVPTMDNSTMSTYVDELSDLGEYLFITSNTENIYETFATDWLQFIGQAPA
ncbi:spherulin 4-like cell surface protein [Xylariales sp. PMI_506]|nr:spherulin 4-like cell surface protein [Xylariales sp. PMI_506]